MAWILIDRQERDVLDQRGGKPDLETPRLARRADFGNLSLTLKADIDALGMKLEALRREMGFQREVLRSSITMRFGSMLVVGLSILPAALKLIAP